MFRISVSEICEVEDCNNYIATSSTITSPGRSKFNNVADFGAYDGGDMYYSMKISTSIINNKVTGICVVNDVQTSAISPYPTDYCDYRLFGDTNNKGFGGGCKTGGDYGMHTASGALSTNTEYLFEMTLHSSSMTGKITRVSDSSVVYNQTITPPKDFSNWHFALFIFNGVDETSNVTYKEVKVKAL